ncbi:MAG: hypothetical protein C5B51_01740 [Terriglobia bacterium]|nr:MAG: hypothetical protein C5B51_01740 [Terriglobia bacterium]
MLREGSAVAMLEHECRALLTRLDRVDYFALIEPMVAAAAPSNSARIAVDRMLAAERSSLRQRISRFIARLGESWTSHAPPQELHRAYVFLRMRFNALLGDFHTFSDVMTQRSESSVGVWLAGLDVAASDALRLPAAGVLAPPVMCYLDPGPGAAIRRARTRLPAGSENPVAIIRVPRERMVGSGVASSLFHEVGHQAAALLDLLPSIRRVLRARQVLAGGSRSYWLLWDRWISEIVADFWSLAHLGVTATLGMIGVVSLPRVFVFRIHADDPHPFPWLRVVLSCAMGDALFPHPQWTRVERLWRSFYPLAGLSAQQRALIDGMLATMPEFVALLAQHRPAALQGRTLPEALRVADRSPARLRSRFAQWRHAPAMALGERPSLALAVFGQAGADSLLSAEAEARTVRWLLRNWALGRSLRIATPELVSSPCRCQVRQRAS